MLGTAVHKTNLFLLTITLLASGCSSARRRIVGKWSGSNQQVEFLKDGTIIWMDGSFGAMSFTGQYSFIDEHRLRMELGGLAALAGMQICEVNIAEPVLNLNCGSIGPMRLARVGSGPKTGSSLRRLFRNPFERKSAPAEVFVGGPAGPSVMANWVPTDKKGWVSLYPEAGGILRILATPPSAGACGMTLLSHRQFTADVDATFEFMHLGYGRTSVGLWSPATRNWLASAALDTDDTNYLNLAAGAQATGYKYPGTPFMNRWVSIRITRQGDTIQFFSDGALKETMTADPDGAVQLVLAVGTARWKSGPNNTTFRLVRAAESVGQ